MTGGRSSCRGGCGRLLGLRNQSGYCRRCFCGVRDPARSAARIERLRATIAAQPADLRSRRMREVSRARLAWCPLEYRDLYRSLTRIKQLSAASARTMVLAQIDIDRDRYTRTGLLQASHR